MAFELKGTGNRLGEAFVAIRASLGPLRAGLAAAKSIVSTSVRGITKIATIPITVSLKAIKGAMSAVISIVRNAMRHVRRIMLLSGVGAGGLLWGFAQFEKAMRQATAVSEVTAEQFKQMSEMARGQAMRLNKSASELARGFYYLGSAGLSAIDQIAAFPAVATLAKAAVLDMATVTEMVVDTMKGFGIVFQNTAQVTDVMAKAVTSSNMTFEQLGTALSYVSGVAKMTNNTLAETVAAIAKMADVGIKGSRAGVYMRTGLLRLMAPMSQARKELEKLGVRIYDEAGKMKPFVQIVGELSEALKGVSEEQRNMAFKALFGQRAITGQLAIFREGRAELERFTDMLRKAGGYAQQVADKQLNSLSEQFMRLIRIVTDTAITIGKAFGPALREAVADLQSVFGRLNEFFKEHELTIAKYALKGYRYIKAFGGFVIDIVKDISANWDERWAFMVKVVKIQMRAARDIIRTTFDDVWATLKEGAIAYGKTLYEVFKKVFTDIGGSIYPWLRQGMGKAWDYLQRYKFEMKRLRKEFFDERPGRFRIGGGELDELQAEAKKRAAAFVKQREEWDIYKKEYPEAAPSESWADVGKRIKEHWLEPYENAKARIARMLQDITEIEKKAASEIAGGLPEAWRDKWARFKNDILKMGVEVDQWYENQKKKVSEAAEDIEGLAKARKDLEAGLGGKVTAETKEEKAVSFVGIKEAWQRMVENIYSPQTKLLSQQTDLLSDIDTGQGDIVEAVRDVEEAVRGVGGPAGKAATRPQTAWEKYQERREQNWAAYLERQLFGRKPKPKEQETREMPVSPKLKPKEYEQLPEWPKPRPLSASIEMPQVPAPIIPMGNKAIRQEAPDHATRIDSQGLRQLLKETRTLIDEVRRVNTSVKKLAPVGAVGT